jgi:uncharacterized protein YvpB
MKLYVSPKVEGRGLRMRTKPGFNGNIVTILQAGEMLETLEAEKFIQIRLGVQNQWLHVKDLEGRSGYCAAWLLVASESQSGAPHAPLGTPLLDTHLQENPELRLLSRHPFSQLKSDQSTQIPSPELDTLTASPQQISPHTLVTSPELTPLSAEQPLPEIPEILPPLATTLLHTVPILAQDDLYGNAACSPVSACMLLEYYHQLNPLNLTVTPQQLIAMLDPGDGTPGKGMSLSNVTDELLTLGYQHISEKIHATLDDLKSELIKGPLIVTVGVTLTSLGKRLIQGPGETIHAMVVKGFSPEAIIVNDPWSGKELRFPYATFEIMWKLGLNGMYMIRL